MNTLFDSFFEILKSITKGCEYSCDGTDDDFCCFCDITIGKEEHDEDCLFNQAEKMLNNHDFFVEQWQNFAQLVAEGHTYTSRNCSIWGEYCSFCYSDKHESNCEHIVIKEFINDLLLLSNEIASDSFNSYHEAIRKEIKKKEEREKKELKSRTCRYCGKVLKSKRGRIEHEKIVHVNEDKIE